MLGNLFDSLVYWTGRVVLHIPYKIEAKPNGSGDTTYNYVEEFFIIVLSFASCIVWSIADGKRKSYNRGYYWVLVIVRYYLAFALMEYGFAKIFKSQFPAPGVSRLLQPYGSSSPMGLAWTFLGYSDAYNYFMGFFEGIGGLLLLFRRTRLFGACIATTVVTNIVMINFCYDVPVKLFSTSLLLMSLFIIAADGGRFLNFFIFNKPVAPAASVSIFRTRKWNIAHKAVKAIFITAFLALSIYDNIDMIGNGETDKTPMAGAYDVQTFICNNDTLAAVVTDSVRWRRIIIGDDYASVRKMNDSTAWYKFKADTVHHTLEMTSDKQFTINMSYNKTDSNTYTMTGSYHGATLYAVIKRIDDKSFLLTNRGFHWINEYPFNR
ncbi:hypothetical protein CJD36_012455 [Flavipsychrobacter stenotrophus]|uniref:DoxX family protein n=2 Tax=Flavipsychrobacter stenotrophus TaxID=2077091 RepID=A0A2S7SW08_9BACT|nr:hypothetical protein CJD36_012455 [Flavipsychrobacter stenotrophus]